MIKEKLNRCRDLCFEMQDIEQRIDELEGELTGIKSPGFEPSYGGSSDDKITALIEARDKLIAIFYERRTEALILRTEMYKKLFELPHSEGRVLALYYMQGADSWETVAEQMHRSLSGIYVLRHNGIKRLENQEGEE